MDEKVIEYLDGNSDYTFSFTSVVWRVVKKLNNMIHTRHARSRPAVNKVVYGVCISNQVLFCLGQPGILGM